VGPPEEAEPSLEDVFVSLARQARRAKEVGDRMKRLLALTWKEFLQLKRDKMTLRMIVHGAGDADARSSATRSTTTSSI
jgi:hypothetical protein